MIFAKTISTGAKKAGKNEEKNWSHAARHGCVFLSIMILS